MFGIGDKGRVSDGMLLFPDGTCIAIEVELTLKGQDRLEKIMMDYGLVDIKEAWYFCPPGIKQQILKVVDNLSFIKVFSLPLL